MIDSEMVTPGSTFDTPHEEGCIVLTDPDEDMSFDAIDSDGFRASFHVRMIESITPPDSEAVRRILLHVALEQGESGA